MEAGLKEHVAFYLTGKRPDGELEGVDELELRPALFANYRDLTQLRYDYPLVLVDNAPADGGIVRTLSAIIDETVVEASTGGDKERLHPQALRLEQSIRTAVANGARGRLSSLWDEAARSLTQNGDERLRETLGLLRAALKVDGAVINCDEDTPGQVLLHTWATVQRARSERSRSEIRTLILKLSDILRVDYAHSEAGLSAESLRASIGSAHAKMFDFEAMSRLVGRTSSKATLPQPRRQRIEQLLETLKSQRFFAPSGSATVQPFDFVFSDCASALAAYQERMAPAIELTRAIAIAELEVDSKYDEVAHDKVFAEFGAGGLDSRDMARFPDYLVHVDAARLHGSELDTLMEILAAGLPFKMLVQTDDLLDRSGVGRDARLTFGSQARLLANMAIGHTDVIVLQSSNSHLYKFRERILSGVAGSGPAIFSIYSGANGHTRDIPAYLMAAAATDSRVFPAFIYDPNAGDTWAERFHLEGNSQLDADWPTHPFAYEDEGHQRVGTTVAFTVADFAACDRRFAKHLALMPHHSWNGNSSPIDEYVIQAPRGVPEQTPHILMIDDHNVLHRVIVDDKLIEATRRTRDSWRSLQELGGVHNSHAERLLERERQAWEESRQQVASTPIPDSVGSAAIAVTADTATSADNVPASEEEPAPSSDEAYVETARCTTCNECIQINNKMFAYDENKQCHIADLSAGTYRDLVEAAENCQVAIIHPGKPRNANEPGLDELLERAAAFQ